MGMQNQHEDEEHNKNVGSAVEGISRGGGYFEVKRIGMNVGNPTKLPG